MREREGRFGKFIDFLFAPPDVNSVEELLSEGMIEKLVRQRRVPFKFAETVKSQEGCQTSLLEYVVPPVGANSQNIEYYAGEFAEPIFAIKWIGIKRYGYQFSLTPEQASEVGRRIKAEMELMIK